MNTRGRPEKLTDELKSEMTRIKVSHKKSLTVSEIQNELRLFLEKKVRKEKDKTWNDALIHQQVEELLPGTSRIQKYNKFLTENFNEARPEDEQWSLATPVSFHPEVLDSILEVWLRTRDAQSHFTIREAKWVSRLHALFKEDADKLWDVARLFAQEELLNEISGVSFHEFEGQKGVLTLYEKWKGDFTSDQSDHLLRETKPPKGRTQAQQIERISELQGKALVDFRKRNAKDKAAYFKKRDIQNVKEGGKK